MEIWKTYNKIYKVSNKGNVRTINDESVKIDETSAGYLYVYSFNNTIHRMVATCFIGKIPKGLVVHHLDHNKKNNNVSNLEITTYAKNTQAAYDKGFAVGKRGEANSMAKLTEFDILKMYDLFRLGYNNLELSQTFGVNDRYISLIRHGKRWKYLYTNTKPFCKSYNYKFSKTSILMAYNLIQEGYKNIEIESITGIERSNISRIRHGKSYVDFITDFKHQLATTIENTE